MDRVDAMKTIQGWTDTSILHFHDLATIGEQLVLTIRLGQLGRPRRRPDEAGTWAQAFRSGIQKYVAAYRAVTGVDLAREANTELPSTLLARRLNGADDAGERHSARQYAAVLRALAADLDAEASREDC